MGILDWLRGVRDRSNDPGCPLNVAEIRARQLYGSSLGLGVMITRDSNHPVCSKCTRRDWFNCGINTTPTQTPERALKKDKPKDERESMEGFRALFGKKE